MFFKFNIYSIFNCNMLYFVHIYLQTEKGMNRRFCPFLNTTAHIKSTNGHTISQRKNHVRQQNGSLSFIPRSILRFPCNNESYQCRPDTVTSALPLHKRLLHIDRQLGHRHAGCIIQKMITVCKPVAATQGKNFAFTAFEELQIHIFVRKLQDYLIGHGILLSVCHMAVSSQTVKTVAVGIDKKPLLSPRHSYIIAAHQAVVFRIIAGDKHIHIVKLTALCLVYCRYNDIGP